MDKQERKIVLITGARSGIGRACADALTAQGHRVYGTSRTPPSDVSEFTFLPMDVNDSDSVESGVRWVLDDAGRIDVVVNNAGFGYGGSIEDTSVAEAQALFETNFFGPMRVCHAVLPTMREQGSGLIVNVSSIGGIMGLPYQGLYSASKFAIEGLTSSLRMEVQRFGINVVLLEPGDVKTPFTANRRHTAASQSSPVYQDDYAIALGRIESDEMNGISAEVVGQELVRIVDAQAPRARYLVGPIYEKLAVVASRLLPGRLFEKLLMSNYGL